MTTRHVLKTDGAWVELRDIEDLRARDKKKVNALIAGLVKVDAETGNVDTGPAVIGRIVQDVPDIVASLLIVAWELPYLPDAKLPSIDPEALDDLKLDDYQRLQELVEPVVALMMPNSSNSVDDYENQASPSEPASA
jgi:hypothetical protein